MNVQSAVYHLFLGAIIVFWGAIFSSSMAIAQISGEKYHDVKDTLHLTYQELSAGNSLFLVSSNAVWSMNDEDKPEFALSGTSEKNWKLVPYPFIPLNDTTAAADTLIYWFRGTFTIDSALRYKGGGISVHLKHGNVEIFVNGDPLFQLFDSSTQDNVGKPLFFPFDSSLTYTIALRYTVTQAPKLYKLYKSWASDVSMVRARPILSLGIEVGLHAPMIANTVRNISWATGISAVIGAFLLAIFVIHFLLYVFDTGVNGNLWYAVFSLFLSFLIITNLPEIHSKDAFLLFYLSYIKNIVLLIVLPVYLGFLYSIFLPALPYYWKYVMAVGGLLALGVIESSRNGLPEIVQEVLLITELVLIFLCLLEAIRINILGVKQNISGAWIIASGAFGFIGVTMYVLIDALLTDSSFMITGHLLWGFFGNQFAMSIYLARDFSRTRKRLSEKLREVQELSLKAISQERAAAQLQLQARLAETRNQFLQADNERKNRELEEARQLQQAILPKGVPAKVRHDIATYNRPAAEVGGDYFDYFTRFNTNLLFVIADATGHGLKAGMMVSITKGLLSILEERESLTDMLAEVSRAIRAMKLGNLFMAMSMAEITQNSITIAGAGIPPLLIYRHANDSIDSILIKGMPLGALSYFPYQQKSLSLAAGDVLLFYTDGILESLNDKNEDFDSDNLEQFFIEACRSFSSADDILANMKRRWLAWTNNVEPHDDVTIIVIKIQ